jgi:hypothetical protein
MKLAAKIYYLQTHTDFAKVALIGFTSGKVINDMARR